MDNLERGDFILRDNGREQQIGMFAVDDARQMASTAEPSAPLTYSNRPPLGSARVTAFLFDQLNTQLTDQQLAKADFLHYLRGMPAAERIAVFALGDSLTLLHDFTEGAETLAAAVNRHANRPARKRPLRARGRRRPTH